MIPALGVQPAVVFGIMEFVDGHRFEGQAFKRVLDINHVGSCSQALYHLLLLDLLIISEHCLLKP
jgi:hypothetical protein